MDTLLDQENQILASGTLLIKAVELSDDTTHWSFAGIASDESADIEGDEILKSMLDLSYAAKRGFVNWNHSRAPEDQIGYLTKAVILEGGELSKLQKEFGIPLSESASVYVEGALYRYQPRAAAVRNILKSATPGYSGGLGLSIDGVMSQDQESGKMMKAFVRGCAMTPAPAHMQTLCQLKKSLQSQGFDFSALGKELTYDSAVIYVLEKRPYLTVTVAKQLVDCAMSK